MACPARPDAGGVAMYHSVVKREEIHMNWDQIKGDWRNMKGKVKERWGDITDDDLDRIEGQRDQLIGTVQKQYGIAKEQAEREVKAWEQSMH